MKRILSLLILLAAASPAFAVTVSSTSATFGPRPAIHVFPHEAVDYSETGTFTGRIQLEKSLDGTNFVPINLSTVNNQGGTWSGTLYNDSQPAYYRFNITTVTAGSFISVLTDRDDLYGQFKNHRQIPTMQLFDETTRFKTRFVFEPTVVSSITLSSMTVINADLFVNSFNVITSSGGAITLGYAPTIAVDRAKNGELYIVSSATNTITFQDDGTLAGSKLQLGAATRALGVGDTLGLLYRDGYWWEIFYGNN